MNKINILLILGFLILFLSSCANEQSSELTIYPAPSGEPVSEDFELKVNRQEVFVYQARVSAWPINQVWPGYQRPKDQTEIASFAYFDCSGKVHIELTSRKKIESVTIRPLSYGIVPLIENNMISFELPGPCQVVVEVNNYHNAFHLFANTVETDKPDLEDPYVHYFGPGVHQAGVIQMKINETVYIEGGAIVHGVIEAKNASNIRILGRGILDASQVGRFDASHMLAVQGCDQVYVEGIIFRDSHKWTVVPVKCSNVKISNIKLIGLWRYNTDGIDVVNSQDVIIEDCFIRAFDDNIVLKGLRWKDNLTEERNVKNIRVRNCVLWNDWGRPLKIGTETKADSISDILFEQCDVIRFVHYAMDMQNGARAHIRDVLFKDIRIEEPIKENAMIAERSYDPDELGRLIGLKIRHYRGEDTIRGQIDQIRFQHINYMGTTFPASTMLGFDEKHLVENIQLEDIFIQGKHIQNIEDLKLETNEFVKQVSIK